MKKSELEFEDALHPIHYYAADDKPLARLRRVFPFSNITFENMSDYDGVLTSLSPAGWRSVYPVLIGFLTEQPERLDENLFESFLRIFEDSWPLEKTILPWLENQTKTERGASLSELETLIAFQKHTQSSEQNGLSLRRIYWLMKRAPFAETL